MAAPAEIASFEYEADGPLTQAPKVNGHRLTSLTSFTVEAAAGELPA